MRHIVTVLVMLVLLLSVLVGCSPQSGEPNKEETTMSQRSKSQKKWNSPPEMQIDPDKVYVATIETERGSIVLELYPEHAPKTVNNFVFLAREGFYDGLSFHRVIPNFMIQGGDPTGTGASGPGYKFEDEVRDNPLVHGTGVISMANAGPNTNGSQFFITHGPQPHLDGKHTVFGQVVEGQDVVDAVQQGDKMTKVTIEEK